MLNFLIQSIPPRLHRWTLTHSFYAVMGGYAIAADNAGAAELSTSYRALSGSEVQRILQHSPSRVPELSEESIFARSQRDTLSKAVALLQIFSFCMTCILRRAEGLSLSVLEVSTIGYAVCAILAYLPWWKKPRISTEPTLIKSNVEVTEDINRDGTSGSGALNIGGVVELVPNAILEKYRGEDFVWAVGFISPSVYGLLHLLAWNDSFPTCIEHILWRISTVVVTASGMAIFLTVFVGAALEEWFRYMLDVDNVNWTAAMIRTLLHILVYSIVLLYILARLYMIIETFRQLLYLPPDAYQVASWSYYLPHIS